MECLQSVWHDHEGVHVDIVLGTSKILQEIYYEDCIIIQTPEREDGHDQLSKQKYKTNTMSKCLK